MLNFFQKIVDADNIEKHGVYTPEEVIKLPEALPSNPNKILISACDKAYELNLIDFQEAVRKLRNHYIFPEISTFPTMEFGDPNISFRTLSPVGQIKEIAENPEAVKVSFLPSEHHTYDASNRTITYFNLPFKCDDELYDHLESGRRIAIKVDAEQNLVWLTTHENDALNKWMDCIFSYERRIALIDQIMKNAAALKTENIRDNGIFKDLPFDVVGAIKINLSGLTERSDGTGLKRNTVNHLHVLDKPMHEYSHEDSIYHGGVLCGSQQGRHMGLGASYNFNFSAKSIEESGITCKSCLSKLKTLLKKHQKL